MSRIYGLPSPVVRVALFALCVVSIYTALAEIGAARVLGFVGLLVWLVLDLEVDAQRDGWRSAVIAKAAALGGVALFAATLAEPVWLKVAGWAGLFVAVAATVAHRERTRRKPAAEPR